MYDMNVLATGNSGFADDFTGVFWKTALGQPLRIIEIGWRTNDQLSSECSLFEEKTESVQSFLGFDFLRKMLDKAI